MVFPFASVRFRRYIYVHVGSRVRALALQRALSSTAPLDCWSGPCHWLATCVAEVVRTCGRSQKGVLRVKITVQSQMRVIPEASCTCMHGNT
jgi:hypothetical protein